MADFPSNPSINDLVSMPEGLYVWDGMAWVLISTDPSATPSAYEIALYTGAVFPPNPSVGDQYSWNGKTWEWDGIAWSLFGAAVPGDPIDWDDIVNKPDFDALYVNVAGDTMTGALVLDGAPTADLEASTKKYVDDNAGGGGGAVDSVFGRTGVVIADSADYAAFYALVSHSHSWAQITGKPTEFPPEAHTHTEGDITNLDKYSVAAADAEFLSKTSGGTVQGLVLINNDLFMRPSGPATPARILFEDTAGNDLAIVEGLEDASQVQILKRDGQPTGTTQTGLFLSATDVILGGPNLALLALGSDGSIVTRQRGDNRYQLKDTTTFLGLPDTPSDYTGQAGLVAAVNGTEDGLEFVAGGGGGAVSSVFSRTGAVVANVADYAAFYAALAHTHDYATEITGKPSTFPPDAHTHDYATEITGKPATFPPDAHTHVWADITDAPIMSFVALIDTPANYTGQAGKVAAVNGTENGLEFITAGAGAGAGAGAAFPVSPAANEQWYLTVDPVGLYQWVDDGNSTQWVQTNGSSVLTSLDPAGVASWRIAGESLECWGKGTSDALGRAVISLPAHFSGPFTVHGTPISGGDGSIRTVMNVSQQPTQFSVDTSVNGTMAASDFDWKATGRWDGVAPA